MKKTIGLVVLAALPVACGTVPTAMDMDAVAPQASAEGTFAAAGRGRTIEPGCPADQDWSAVTGLLLRVAKVGKTSVTLRVDLLMIGDLGPSPCFTPIFTVKPYGRGIALAPGKELQEITLSAPSGSYEVTVTAAERPDLIASLTVDLPSKDRR